MLGYDFAEADFPTLLLRKFYPERTDHESGIIRDFLVAHLREYDRVSFSVRLGTPIAPNPESPLNVQRSTIFSSLKRIDVVGWQGHFATLIDAKQRIRMDALGVMLGYRQLFLEEIPDAPEPRLVVIGRIADEDAIRILTDHGVDVLLYPEAVAA